jgi:hypothetical protein
VFTGIDDAAAETVIEVRVGLLPPPPLELETVRLAVPWTVPDFAMTLVCPLAAPLAIPEELTEAMLAFDDDH